MDVLCVSSMWHGTTITMGRLSASSRKFTIDSKIGRLGPFKTSGLGEPRADG